MKVNKITAALAVMGLAMPMLAAAQSAADMNARITALEERFSEDAEAKLNRTAVKVGAIEEAVETQGLKGLKISGYMDPTYVSTNRQHRSGFQFLSNQQASPTAVPDYQFDNGNFGTVQLDFQKEIEGGNKFRLTLMPERGGLGNGISGSSIVHEASILAPLGEASTALIAGQIPDWSGYEFAQPTQTKLITHNMLYDYTMVAGYTGAGMQLVRGPFTIKALLGNITQSMKVANSASSNNGDPALAWRVDYYDFGANEFAGWGAAGTHGNYFNSADGNFDSSGNIIIPRTRADIMEIDAWYAKAEWSVSGQASFGKQANAAINGGDSGWWGVSSTVSYKLTPALDFTVRYDYINNEKNGGGLLGYGTDSRAGIGSEASVAAAGAIATTPYATGSTATDKSNGANRSALTMGYKYTLNPNVAIKLEYRLDKATQRVFRDLNDNAGLYDTNQLYAASVVANF